VGFIVFLNVFFGGVWIQLQQTCLLRCDLSAKDEEYYIVQTYSKCFNKKWNHVDLSTGTSTQYEHLYKS